MQGTNGYKKSTRNPRAFFITICLISALLLFVFSQRDFLNEV